MKQTVVYGYGILYRRPPPHRDSIDNNVYKTKDEALASISAHNTTPHRPVGRVASLITLNVDI